MSGVTYEQLLHRVIEDGIAASEKDYANDTEKREGSVAGFEVCRGKAPAELGRILTAARLRATKARLQERREGYWRLRCFELEVEWVCNVISAALLNQGKPTIITPTVNGAMRAAAILGVAPPSESGK